MSPDHQAKARGASIQPPYHQMQLRKVLIQIIVRMHINPLIRLEMSTKYEHVNGVTMFIRFTDGFFDAMSWCRSLKPCIHLHTDWFDIRWLVIRCPTLSQLPQTQGYWSHTCRALFLFLFLLFFLFFPFPTNACATHVRAREAGWQGCKPTEWCK